MKLLRYIYFILWFIMLIKFLANDWTKAIVLSFMCLYLWRTEDKE